MAAARPAPLPPLLHRRAGPRAPRDSGARYAGIAGAVAFHVVLIVALLYDTPVRRWVAPATPIVVSVITPPAPEVKPLTPKPSVAPKPPRTELARPVALPREVPREPAPISAEPVAAAPITLVAPPTSAAPVAAPAIVPDPPPIVPPRFNADYLQNPAPAYPALARRLHEQGKVLVRVLVGIDGTPERIELTASSGFPRLDKSALETIRSWKFVPARQGAERVAAWVVVPITFTLDG